MTWRSAFLAQAQSDNEVRKLLNRSKAAYAHQLHYLQMATEKLSKGYAISTLIDEPPAFSHSAFDAFLRHLKSDKAMRKHLGYTSSHMFSAFIDSLLPFALEIEHLAPTFAGITKPNPEYPWKPTASSEVEVPADYDFPVFNPNTLQIIQLVNLVDRVLSISA